MATGARNTAAHSRAPFPPQSSIDPANAEARVRLLEFISAMQVTAELVDTMMLSVTLMIEDQKRLMRQAGSTDFLCDNELWQCMGVMLETVRGHMHDFQKSGEAMESEAARSPGSR